MSIDIRSEEVIHLGQARRYFPPARGGDRIALSTLYRYTKTGHKGVVLESVPAGGRLCTSVEAIQRFFDRLAALRSGKGVKPRESGRPLSRGRKPSRTKAEAVREARRLAFGEKGA